MGGRHRTEQHRRKVADIDSELQCGRRREQVFVPASRGSRLEARLKLLPRLLLQKTRVLGCNHLRRSPLRIGRPTSRRRIFAAGGREGVEAGMPIRARLPEDSQLAFAFSSHCATAEDRTATGQGRADHPGVASAHEHLRDSNDFTAAIQSSAAFSGSKVSCPRVALAQRVNQVRLLEARRSKSR